MPSRCRQHDLEEGLRGRGQGDCCQVQGRFQGFGFAVQPKWSDGHPQRRGREHLGPPAPRQAWHYHWLCPSEIMRAAFSCFPILLTGLINDYFMMSFDARILIDFLILFKLSSCNVNGIHT